MTRSLKYTPSLVEFFLPPDAGCLSDGDIARGLEGARHLPPRWYLPIDQERVSADFVTSRRWLLLKQVCGPFLGHFLLSRVGNAIPVALLVPDDEPSPRSTVISRFDAIEDAMRDVVRFIRGVAACHPDLADWRP